MKNNRRNVILRIFAAASIGIFAGSAFAAAPGNDNFADAEVLSGIRLSVARTNTEASKETGEPNHAANAGGKSVWFKWTAPMSRTMSFSTNRSAGNIDTLLQIYVGNSLANLSSRGFSNDISAPNNKRSFVRFNATQGTTYYIAVDGYNNGQITAEGAFTLDIKPSFDYQGADYDADGMTDFAVFRPSSSTWYVSGSTREINSQFGTAGDIPVTASRGSTSEFTVFRPSTGYWFRNYCCGLLTANWGTAGDIPVPESFGGEAASSYTVFRPSTGAWYIYGFGGADRYYQFGQAGDIPLPGNYSADWFADIAVFRPSSGTWFFLKRQNGNPGIDQFSAVQFGASGDKPVPADYDGDGILDVAVYRPSVGTWFVLRSSDGQLAAFKWGVEEDVPTTGDFDGDGIFDYAVFRPSNGTWYVYRSSDETVQIKQHGAAGDVPMTSNYGK